MKATPMNTARPKRVAYGTLGRVTLGVIAGAGVISLALVAPNALLAFGVLARGQGRSSRKPYPCDVRSVVKRLSRKGLVRCYQSRGETVVSLTEKGKRELLKYQLQEKKLLRTKWDGKWRLIAFDIEERRRGVRDRVREDLRSFGLVQLQESLWVYPYDCEEIVTLLKADNRVGKNLLYIVAGEIENDDWLKKAFALCS